MTEPHPADSLACERLLGYDQVAALVNVSAQTIRRWVAARVFPPPLKLGRSVRWRSSDVEQWLRDQESSR